MSRRFQFSLSALLAAIFGACGGVAGRIWSKRTAFEAFEVWFELYRLAKAVVDDERLAAVHREMDQKEHEGEQRRPRGGSDAFFLRRHCIFIWALLG
ncbi:MAG TPA: hypothetical protein VG125_03225 [Pirellulales bacterium]|jgi:hypothetical protein|nr:hypothetical protein [Pirellulales bacterium]